MSADEEIRRVFSLTWGLRSHTGMTVDEVARLWSLDHQWMPPSAAEEAVSALISAGWLVLQDGVVEHGGRSNFDPAQLDRKARGLHSTNGGAC